MTPPTDEEVQAEKVRDLLVHIHTRVFERAAAYTNLVMFGGYAAAFAVWNFTRSHLTYRSEIVIALLLTVSLMAFVFFEVFKMAVGTGALSRQRALLAKSLPAAEFLAELKALETHESWLVSQRLMPIWKVALFVSVSTALGVVALLLWNFIAILLGMHRWP